MQVLDALLDRADAQVEELAEQPRRAGVAEDGDPAGDLQHLGLAAVQTAEDGVGERLTGRGALLGLAVLTDGPPVLQQGTQQHRVAAGDTMALGGEAGGDGGGQGAGQRLGDALTR
ncbi:hypothetical protein SANTM175S_01032 [Streptomyces antimycoticus]